MSECVGCGKAIAPNKSGQCRRCFTIAMNADPAFQARRTARIREKMADPVHRAKMAATIQRNSAKWRASPEGRAWMEGNGKRLATEVLSRPEVAAKANSPESKMRAIRTKREKRYGWFPPERTDDLEFLMRRKKLTGHEAVAIIRNEERAVKERREAAMSPFERQMRAIEGGANLTANENRPAPGNQVVRRFG